MAEQYPFKWRHFEAEFILLSYRDVEEMRRERGLLVDHTTIYRLPSSGMPQNSKNAVDLTSKPATTPGKLMRRP